MTQARPSIVPSAASATRFLRRAALLVLVLTFLGWTLLPEPWGNSPDSRTATLAVPVFLGSVLLMLGVSLLGRPPRAARAMLLIGMALWGIGAWAITSVGTAEQAAFPAPGEVWTLTAYLVFGLFLFTDTRTQGRLAPAVWLDAIMIGGATACTGTGVLLLPWLNDGPIDARALVSFAYPAVDLALAAAVLVQVLRGRRHAGLRALAIGGGFLILAVADLTLASPTQPGVYERGAALELFWGLGLWSLAAGASLPPRSGEAPPAEPSDRVSGLAAFSGLVGAGSIVLVSAGGDGFRGVAVPAAVTLLAGQARLWLALRDARGAGEARRLSRTDDLTGLPNRRALTEHLRVQLRAPGPLALMLLDLDGFKEVNDGLGHLAGDALLSEAAERVRTAVPEGALVSRVGGDEFALAVAADDEGELLRIAGAVLARLRDGFVVDDVPLNIDASIGVAVRQPDDDDGELLRCADVAMYQAKAARHGALVYDREQDSFSRGRLRLADGLRRAIEASAAADGDGHGTGDGSHGLVELWYQPQLDAADGSVRGLEALVRWRHPEQGLVSPGEFLPIARRTGLMPRLSQEVARQAVRDARRWRELGLPHRVAINVAPAELLGGTLVPYLLRLLRDAALPPNSIMVEVTEESFLSAPERARDVLEDLHAHGVLVSIDDYGTGFSSLAYLRDLPVEELKIDRSFVVAMQDDERSRMIVSSTVRMAHALGMHVVAEGVEDAGTAGELRRLGVDSVQGFHFARPMPFTELTPWLQAVPEPAPEPVPAA